jgi:hypothetical protein
VSSYSHLIFDTVSALDAPFQAPQSVLSDVDAVLARVHVLDLPQHILIRFVWMDVEQAAARARTPETGGVRQAATG